MLVKGKIAQYAEDESICPCNLRIIVVLRNELHSRTDINSTHHNDLKTEEDESLLCTKDKPPIYKLPTQTRLKLSIRKWNVAAKWRWSIGEGPCGICRETFDSCCVTCQTPGDECPIAIGICRHAFHMHCIVKWTKSQKVAYPLCPLCRQKWEFAPMEHTNGCPTN